MFVCVSVSVEESLRFCAKRCSVDCSSEVYLQQCQSFHGGMEASVRVRDTALKLEMACNRVDMVVPWHLVSSTLTLMQWYPCGMSNVLRSESQCWYKHGRGPHG